MREEHQSSQLKGHFLHINTPPPHNSSADRGLGSTQARAELPARSRWTIAASRIEPHRAGAVALRAVEHTDPDAVVGGPVRGCAAGYPHARLHVVGELPVAGAFVADRRNWLCCDDGCRGHLDSPIPCWADGYARVPRRRAAATSSRSG